MYFLFIILFCTHIIFSNQTVTYKITQCNEDNKTVFIKYGKKDPKEFTFARVKMTNNVNPENISTTDMCEFLHEKSFFLYYIKVEEKYNLHIYDLANEKEVLFVENVCTEHGYLEKKGSNKKTLHPLPIKVSSDENHIVIPINPPEGYINWPFMMKIFSLNSDSQSFIHNQDSFNDYEKEHPYLEKEYKECFNILPTGTYFSFYKNNPTDQLYNFMINNEHSCDFYSDMNERNTPSVTLTDLDQTFHQQNSMFYSFAIFWLSLQLYSKYIKK